MLPLRQDYTLSEKGTLAKFILIYAYFKGN